MAEKRRLQGEIDRTLKKVFEGRSTFKETLDKFESATNHTQKEKHEADLKKDIKKLQRFRDSIKNWLASPEVKDKNQLCEARKLIESDMERFKVIEKETKTKAYSKEGLFSDQKRDPMQKEKDEHIDWLRIQISKLQKKAETCDFDMHNINAKKKRNADRDRLGELGQRLTTFRNHITKQDMILRLVDHDRIDLDKLRDLRFSFEEFLSNPDQELYKGDQGMFMYDELNIEQLSLDLTMSSELELSLGPDSPGGAVVVSVVSKEVGLIITVQPDTILIQEESEKTRLIIKDRVPNRPKQRQEVPRTVMSTPIKSSSVALFDGPDFFTLNYNDSVKSIVDDSTLLSTMTSLESLKTLTTPVLETVSFLEPAPNVETDFADVIKSTVISTDTFMVLTTTASAMYPYTTTQEMPPRSRVEPSPPPQLVDLIPTAPCSSQKHLFYVPHNFIPMMQPQQNEINFQHIDIGPRPPITSLRQDPHMVTGRDSTFDMILEPGDAMSPFRNHNFQVNDVYNNQVIAMEHGRVKQPLSSDSEKARMIIYKNEVPVPDYYPKEPAQGCDTEEYYMRLDSDTLFFIFYYFEGSRAQYLAAKALKKMSWRFHTGHMCWFQRHEEPKLITDNSESGTYIFYDFESMSRQKKENFTFSYNYLEDKDF